MMNGVPFKILKKIGEGEFGHIFLAESPEHPERVVLKQIDKKHGCR